MTELRELMAQAQARARERGYVDPEELIEPDEGHIDARRARRRRLLRLLLAELLVARENREPWYVWVSEDWPRIRGGGRPG